MYKKLLISLLFVGSVSYGMEQRRVLYPVPEGEIVTGAIIWGKYGSQRPGNLHNQLLYASMMVAQLQAQGRIPRPRRARQRLQRRFASGDAIMHKARVGIMTSEQ